MKKCRLPLILLAIVIPIWVGVYLKYTAEPAQTQSAKPAEVIKAPEKEKLPPPTIESLYAAINAERAKVGVKPLTIEPLLNRSAQLKADDMNAYKYFDHLNPTTGKRGYTYIIDVGANCIYQSENIKHDKVDRFNNIKDIVATWMTSPPHRGAILDPRYETTGFGISGSYTVEHFCDIY